MKKWKYRFRKYKFTYIKVSLFTLFLCMLPLKGYTPFEHTGENFFHLYVNGQYVGTLEDKQLAEDLVVDARKCIATESSDLVFMESNTEVIGEEVLWGRPDKYYRVRSNIEKVLRSSVIETMHRSYTIKVNEFIVNLASLEDVTNVLQAAVDKYDTEDKFVVDLAYDKNREFSVLETLVNNTEEQPKEAPTDYSVGGIASVFANLGDVTVRDENKDFEDFDLGIQSMDFSEKVEVVEVYLPEWQLSTYEQAVEEIIKDKEVPGVYEVVAGDTLTEIAIKVNIPMDQIIAMNDSLENENTTLHIGQQLVISVPEPELSVVRTEQNYYEETYDADVIIIDVDEWFTTQTEVLQQPSAGFRKVIANVSYLNDKEISREIVKQEVVMEAKPKIMKRGTKIPPTYIKPISGGRISSRFGRRASPTAGASSYHKGIDWAVAQGTAVRASSGGTVVKAGWGSGYGYVVYINHIDGRQTRYAHLSKVLVSVGQKVSQGDRIALSGNTGISTGPHLHFEMLINGSQVDPLKYIDK